MQKLREWLSQWQERRQEQRDRLIQNIAHRLYLNRVARGREGDEETDLAKAEKLVRNPFTRTAFRFGNYWRNRVDAVESTWMEAALEGLVNDLQNLAIIELLNIIASLSLISTAFGFFSEADERQRQRQNEAWQVISSAVGQTHEAGRVAAIEELYADGVELYSLDINRANIRFLDLSPRCILLGWHIPLNSRLCGFKQQIVSEQTAMLELANFQKVQLLNSDLQKAILKSSKFQKAYLLDNNLQEADLEEIILEEAKLFANDLSGAKLSKGNLQKALLIGNNLREADLEDSNLDNAFLIDMDLREVKGLKREQLEGDNSPFICNTRLHERFGIDKDRDCDNLAQALLKNFPKQEDGGGFSSLEEVEKDLARYREDAKSANEED